MPPLPTAISPLCPLASASGQTALFYTVKLEMADAAAVLLRAPPCAGYVDLGLAEVGCAASSSPLYVAVSRGDAEMARLLLRNGADPALVGQHRRTDDWPRTPLGKACAVGSAACVQAILSAPRGLATLNVAPGAPPSRVALLECVWALHAPCVEALLAHDDVDALAAAADGSAALHEAAYWGKGRQLPSQHSAATAMLTNLIAHHAARHLPVDVFDFDGCTPLCFACAAADDQCAWVRALLDAGASPAVRPSGGFNAHGWRAALLENGGREAERGRDALFDVPSLGPQPWGGRPLEEAASRGHRDCLAALLAAVAASTAKTADATGGAHATGGVVNNGDATAFSEAASQLIRHAADAASQGADAPLTARDLIEVGCTPAMVALLLAEAPLAQGAPSCVPLYPTPSAHPTPRCAERVHDDAPLVPATANGCALFASSRLPRSPNRSPSRSPKTPQGIGPAAAALNPSVFSL